jgi:hypothetical protein
MEERKGGTKMVKKILSLTFLIIFCMCLYYILIKELLFTDIKLFYDVGSVVGVILIPIILTFISITGLNLKAVIKDLRNNNVLNYNNIIINIINIHISNIIGSYIISIFIAAIGFFIVFNDKSAWGPSIAFFILSSLYTVIQIFLIFNLVKRRLKIKNQLNINNLEN